VGDAGPADGGLDASAAAPSGAIGQGPAVVEAALEAAPMAALATAPPPDAAEELWKSELGGARRGAVWRALLLDGLSPQSLALPDSYESLCQTPSSYDAVIQRDLGRTLPHEDLFRDRRGKGQSALFRLLHALAVHLWDIGYVQSLNFVIATLIGVFPDDEALVFHCAQALLFRYSLADFYRPRFPKLGVTVWQFDCIVEGFLPKVHTALQRHGVTAEYYAMQWFLTLFASDLPQPVVRRVWDRFLVAGWRIIVQVGLALLYQAQDAILAFDTCEVLTFLKRLARARRQGAEELLAAASAFEVSHRMLSELEAAYGWEGGFEPQLLVTKDLNSGTVHWAVHQRPPASPTAASAVASSPPSSPQGGGFLEAGKLPKAFGRPGNRAPAAASSQCQQRERSAPASAPASASASASSAAGPWRGVGDAGGGGMVLPFLLHNLDTGETTVMEEEWHEYNREGETAPKPAAAVAPSGVRRWAPTAPQSPMGPTGGGSFWLQGRQQQGLRALGKT